MGPAHEILLAFAPGIVWLFYFWRRDRNPEPRRTVLRVFALGCISAFGVLILRPWLEVLLLPSGPLLGRSLADSYVITGGSEELVKVIAFALGVLWHEDLDEPIDGLVYGAAAGLGFASVENVFFAVNAEGILVLLLRAFTATVLHACLTALLGFALGMTRLARRRERAASLAAATLVGVTLLHGTYDLFLFYYAQWRWISLLIVLPGSIAIVAAVARWCDRRVVHLRPWLLDAPEIPV